MQFGPSSQTEFMELGGEDEIDKMREGMHTCTHKHTHTHTTHTRHI